MSEWQPIETAPKTGDVLLCIQFNYGPCIVVGEWNEDRYAKKPRPYWSNDRERIFGTIQTRACQPTHWMPLPPPPEV